MIRHRPTVREDTIVNLGLLFMGGMFLLIGLFRRLAYDIDLGWSWASPSEWQRNPQRAAEKHQRRERLISYVLMVCGTLLFGVGLAVP